MRLIPRASLLITLSSALLFSLGCSDDDKGKGGGGGSSGSGGSGGGGATDCAAAARQIQQIAATHSCTDNSADVREVCENTPCRSETDAFLRCALAVPAAEWVCASTDGVDIPSDRCEDEDAAYMACVIGG
ncbi:MAG: hypothetical protein KF915_18290 [Polyangiaceae bacterium]|nr:hypothetical protein [Polyangiaceae bacterium]